MLFAHRKCYDLVLILFIFVAHQLTWVDLIKNIMRSNCKFKSTAECSTYSNVVWGKRSLKANGITIFSPHLSSHPITFIHQIIRPSSLPHDRIYLHEPNSLVSSGCCSPLQCLALLVLPLDVIHGAHVLIVCKLLCPGRKFFMSELCRTCPIHWCLTHEYYVTNIG